jgi:hypothetical protein
MPAKLPIFWFFLGDLRKSDSLEVPYRQQGVLEKLEERSKPR